MGEPDVAAEAGRVSASIRQAVGTLTGDPAVEAQDGTEKSGAEPGRSDDVEVKPERVDSK